MRAFDCGKGLIAIAGATLAAVALAGCTDTDDAKPTAAAVAAIAISPQVPAELNADGGGAPNAMLDQAAAFAWQEFIALNWPALTQRGGTPLRDTPDTTCLFGDPSPRCAGQPLTWQTFRGKAEIFSKVGSKQTYDNPPAYTGLYPNTIAPCAGVRPASKSAWVNLDETTEIGLAAMYSGVGIPAPTPDNSDPQLVRFMAKANRAEFNYVNLIGAATGIPTPLANATMAYVPQNGSPPPGSTNLVSLPNNTIEIKAGWRQLNPNTEDPSRFHTTRVRYYEPSGSAQCYREAVWGLVSLHIIQKTASAPYFIFATFEQADNIRTESGQPVEDADGNVINNQPCRSDQQAPCPTTPTTVYQDSPQSPPDPTVSLSPQGAAYCTANPGTRPANRLYFMNSAADTAVPNQGFICINSRTRAIPPTIVSANQTAHAAIIAYNQANNIQSSPWLYYKLINVQYRPMTLQTPGQLYTGLDAATFYQANSVVESNYTLQNFSGRFVPHAEGAPSTGTKTDYASRFGGAAGAAVPNMYYKQVGQSAATGYDMGGCMGCHATAQRDGADFSFILDGAPVGNPEPIPTILPGRGAVTAPARAVQRWRREGPAPPAASATKS